MIKALRLLAIASTVGLTAQAAAQVSPPPTPARAAASGTDADTPLHRLSPGYPTPYRETTPDSVKAVMDRVLGHMERQTPMRMLDRRTNAEVALGAVDEHSRFAPAGYRLVSYEWGVTYAGTLLAAGVTGDQRYARYAADRVNYASAVAAAYRAKPNIPPASTPIRGMLAPHSLDDSGAMAAALIKVSRAGLASQDVRPQIDTWVNYVSKGQYRLKDGTLARMRPLPSTLWLDDLYMSVPALAQMGAMTGERRYYDHAVRQMLQFADRMFVKETGLWMHGWVEGMNPHPAFYWGRANGWAIMSNVELLEVLPANHPGRPRLLELLRAHVAGIARLQSGNGLWNQLLDRNDSYQETSASTMFAFAIARAANRGWIDRAAYGPVALLAWNGVTTKVNAEGEVEDVVVGTGMGFDPAFYYHRPVHVRAAHGYGPIFLAGAEIITLLKSWKQPEQGGEAVIFG